MSLTDFSFAGFIGGALFSLVGYGAYRYGKNAGKSTPLMLGIALMLYPYFVSNGAAVWLVGAGLSGCLFLFRE
jgi:hypothetical protein